MNSETEQTTPTGPDSTRQPANIEMAGQSLELHVVADLRTLLAWASFEWNLELFSDAIALVSSLPAEELPLRVRACWERVSAIDLRAFGAAEAEQFDVAVAVSRVFNEIGDASDILLSRALALARRRTLADLATVRGVSSERVRQIESERLQTLRRAVDHPANDILKRTATRLARQLGQVCTLESLSVDLPSIASNDAADLTNTELKRWRLLLWLAGPYRLRADGWVVSESVPSIVHDSVARVEAHASSGPVTLAGAGAALGDLGITPQFQQQWLLSLPGFRVFDDRIALWSGTLLDKAETVLRLREQPMSADEIAAQIGAEASSPRGLATRMAQDVRFSRCGMKLLALREWGYPEYSTVERAMVQEIEAQGGEVGVEWLAERLERQFGISRQSVRTYANGLTFVSLGSGQIRLRNESDPLPTVRPIQDARRCYRLTSGWAIRLPVTADTLRGSGTPITPSFVAHVGVHCLADGTVPSSYGDILVAWTSVQAFLGSLRRVALELGADIGDYLFVEFTANRHFEFMLVRSSELQGSGGTRLAREIGTTLDAWNGNVTAALAHALGRDYNQNVEDLGAHLRARGESDLAQLLECATGGLGTQEANSLD
jgi:hypothetical protein